MSLPPPPIGTEPGKLLFGRFSLDLGAGRLLRDDRDVLVRPKTYAVLRHLLENAGRLVPKDEIFAVVWPKLAVTDDVLVQSIGELRRALAPDGEVIIKTIPRRGYRIDVPIAWAPAAGPLQTPNAVGTETTANAGAASPGYRNRRSWLAVASAIGLSVALWNPAGTSRQLIVGEKAVGVARPADRIGLAVLPFSDGGGRHDDYVADGITQDIIAALGRFQGMTVMSWNAVRRHRGAAATPSMIARSLGVHYQVEGRIQRSDGRLVVTAQLIDAGGRVLWSERFDEAVSEVFAVQRHIAAGIAGTLAVRVAKAERHRAFAKATSDLGAYDLLLRTRQLVQVPERAHQAQARDLLRRALALDPGYADAHAALAETFHTDLSMGWSQIPGVTLAQAEEHANLALGLDADHVGARVVLGRVHILHRRYDRARIEFDLATRSNPSDPRALGGLGHLLTWLGEADAAITVLEQALRIDPHLNAIDRFSLALAYYAKGRYADAAAQADSNVRMASDTHYNRVLLAAAYAQIDRAGDAHQAIAEMPPGTAAFIANGFGTKFSNPSDLEHLRDGLRKAGLRPG